MPYNKIFSEEEWEIVNPLNKEILRDYILEYESRKKKPSTIYQYNNDLRIIMIFILRKCNNKPITELNKKSFRNFSLWLSNDLKVSNARVNRLMSCCRSLLAYVEEEDDYDYDVNMAAKVKGLPKETVRDIVFLSDETILKLCDRLIEEERYKEATLLALAYDSAARKNELAQVEKFTFLNDEVNCTNKVIAKRGKTYRLIYHSLTKKCAKLYLQQRGEDDIPNLFIVGEGEEKHPATADNLYDWVIGWRKKVEEITGEKQLINPHSLRHSCLNNQNLGTHYICKELGIGEVSLEELKILANHNDISTTSSYLEDRSTEELEKLYQIKIST